MRDSLNKWIDDVVLGAELTNKVLDVFWDLDIAVNDWKPHVFEVYASRFITEKRS